MNASAATLHSWGTFLPSSTWGRAILWCQKSTSRGQCDQKYEKFKTGDFNNKWNLLRKFYKLQITNITKVGRFEPNSSPARVHTKHSRNIENISRKGWRNGAAWEAPAADSGIISRHILQRVESGVVKCLSQDWIHYVRKLAVWCRSVFFICQPFEVVESKAIP
jgi:hypothetical protein